MNWLAKRFTEPSTHAGLAGLSQAIKAFAPQYAPIFDGITAAFAIAAFSVSEKSSNG